MRICPDEMPRATAFSAEHEAACWLHHEMAPRVVDASRPTRGRETTGQNSTNDRPAGRALLDVRNLKKHFRVGRQTLKAVDGISLRIEKGETFGLVGESGCGKSTTGRVLVRLYEPTSGEVVYDGEDPFGARGEQSRRLNRKAQMIFQDPHASQDPRMRVLDIVAEGLDIHGLAGSKEQRAQRVHGLLETVELSPEHADRYPHQFSGGQRQRVGIARALAVDPEFIVADEPVSDLDVSIRAQIINLMKRLQREKGLTYLFISHDLSVVRYVSDRIGVMYLGILVEVAASDELCEEPLHPYTRALLSAVPFPDPDVERRRGRMVLEGEVPSPVNPPSGCRFRTRCPHAMDVCAEVVPQMREIRPGHWAACHLH
jgi:oligopeptide/dipeptide ABC transporter ATP-binding protein